MSAQFYGGNFQSLRTPLKLVFEKRLPVDIKIGSRNIHEVFFGLSSILFYHSGRSQKSVQYANFRHSWEN